MAQAYTGVASKTYSLRFGEQMAGVAEQSNWEFYSLTPDRVLDAVEAMGLQCTGRCIQLNSMENRVFAVEVEVNEVKINSPADRYRVVKFYRPGRWSKAQIQEEHDFLLALQANELSVLAPVVSESGESVIELEEPRLFGAIFPKGGGRLEPELNDVRLARLGRLLARVHAIGATQPSAYRPSLSPTTYGRDNLSYLLEGGKIPAPFDGSYAALVEAICVALETSWSRVALQRIHGDCHIGNVLWDDESPVLVDFDDMVMGPAVQDLWLVLPGRDDEARRQRDILLGAYETMRSFDWASWALVEGLRALRFVNFAAWIGRRWEDPSFKLAFPYYNTPLYWQGQIADLREQLALLHNEQL